MHCHNRLLDLLFFLDLLFADERADDADFFVNMFVEVKTVLFGGAQLHEVVVKRLLADFDFLGSLLKRHFNKDTVLVEASVQQPPQTHLLDHCLDCPFLNARLHVVGVVSACSPRCPVPLFHFGVLLLFLLTDKILNKIVTTHAPLRINQQMLKQVDVVGLMTRQISRKNN